MVAKASWVTRDCSGLSAPSRRAARLSTSSKSRSLPPAAWARVTGRSRSGVYSAALNWSWLVAMGIAPLLVTVLPCAVMCGLGLCMNRIMGGSCSTSSSAADQPGTPMPKIARVTAASESGRRAPVSQTGEVDALPDLSIGSAVEPAPEEQPQLLKERE